MYVPRDETFEEIKQKTFSAGRLKALLHNLIPSIAATLSSLDIPFQCFDHKTLGFISLAMVSPCEFGRTNRLQFHHLGFREEIGFKIGIHKIQFGENFQVHLIRVTHEQKIISFQDFVSQLYFPTGKPRELKQYRHESSKYKTYLIRSISAQRAP